MKAFLEHLADEIIAKTGDDPGRLCIVLPNRRAGLFLKRHLSDRLKKSFWSPEIYSIEDFVTKASGHLLADQATLIFELFRVHTTLHRENPQDFEAFAGWGQMLLSDFNELDLYLADPVKIFRDISETRALTVWNLGQKPLTEFEQNYIRFYQGLLDYYTGLRDRLLEQHLIYKGLAYRYVAENIEAISQSFQWEKIWFAGLNALSTSEETMIRYLLDKGNAEVFWDADKYYLEDAFQEAGHFIRDHLKNFGHQEVKWVGEHFKEKKNITITGISGYNGQAAYAGNLLRAMALKPEELHRTAVILADEKMLLPMLNCLPEEISTFNITMGFPMRLTPVYQLFRTLFRLQVHGARIRERKGGTIGLFYARDILNILSSPYMAAFGEESREAFSMISRRFRRSGKVVYTHSELQHAFSTLPEEARRVCQGIFESWNTPLDAISGIQTLLESLRELLAGQPEKDLLELEHFYHFARIIRKVSDLLKKNPFIQSLRSLEKVLLQILDSYTLPFFGEPLEGIQLMGVLETRAIDFDNIILLSVNEGILPSGKMPQSFIPFDIKRDHGLPTHREKDAIFAYHFYRLLQRAKHVHLVYETEGSKLGGGERSRFITQLLFELPRYNSAIQPTEKIFSLPPAEADNNKPVRFTWDEASRERALLKARTGLSPSALNTYIQCSLRFYFQEILGLSEAEEIEEEIEASTLGEVIHRALHKLFEPYEGARVRPDDIKAMAGKAEAAVREAYSKVYSEGDISQGKNLLTYEVSKQAVKSFLREQGKELADLEKNGTGLDILHLEKFFSIELRIHSGEDELDVRLKGKADRIDLAGGNIRIVDYKSGSVRASELKVGDWEGLTTDPKFGKAFQLLLYAFLYHKDQHAEPEKMETGNISLKKLSSGFMPVHLPENLPMGLEVMKALEELVVKLLENIFDPVAVFIQTEDENNCRYCPFTGICKR